jgi:hypothetical protein
MLNDSGTQYIYGNGMVSHISGASTYYYLADGLGSIVAVVDSSGAVVAGFRYDAYGNPFPKRARTTTKRASPVSRPTRRGCSTCGRATTTRRPGAP